MFVNFLNKGFNIKLIEFLYQMKELYKKTNKKKFI